MRKQVCVLVVICLSFGFGCAPAPGGPATRQLSEPPSSPPHAPAEKLPAVQDALLTQYEILKIHEVLAEKISSAKWQTLKLNQKALLAGAFLFDAMNEVGSAHFSNRWDQMTDSQIVEILEIFFDTNFDLKTIKE